MKRIGFLVDASELKYSVESRGLSNNVALESQEEDLPSVYYLNTRFSDEVYLPLAIFQSNLTPLQAIVKYLKEQSSFSNKKIAVLTGRDTKTIWITYSAVKNKKFPTIVEEDKTLPMSIFSDSELSIFEAVVNYLRKAGLSYAEISRLMNRDQRTIWTVYSRSIKKMVKNKNER